MAIYLTKKVLITVKTYPQPSKKTIEASCTAGITEDRNWIRLFPLPFRYLEYEKQFKKYQWIEAKITKSSDPRPESYKVDLDSIKLIGEPIGTINNWRLRKEIVLPLSSPSLCHLQKTKIQTGATLGIFKPKIIKEFTIEPEDSPDWTEQELAKLSQQSMFDKNFIKPLEKIPYKFFYSFYCNDSNCNSHRLSIIDWEIGASFRNWLKTYGQQWSYYLKLKFEQDVINKFDTYFYVGTTITHPDVWVITGLFYPHKEVFHATG